jgi:hypothetical protein
MVPLPLAVLVGTLVALVVGVASAAAMHWWCVHRRRPRMNVVGRPILDELTGTVLGAVDHLPLGEASATLWGIARLVDTMLAASALWTDSADVSAAAAVERIAAASPPSSRRPRPRLVPPPRGDAPD